MAQSLATHRRAFSTAFWDSDLSHHHDSSEETTVKQPSTYMVNTNPHLLADPCQITGPTNPPRNILTGNSKPRRSST